MGEQKEDWLTTAQWLKVDNETQQIRTRQVLFTTQQTAGTQRDQKILLPPSIPETFGEYPNEKPCASYN